MAFFEILIRMMAELQKYIIFLIVSILILVDYKNAIVMEVGPERAHLNYNQIYNFLFNFIYVKVTGICINEKWLDKAIFYIVGVVM